MQAELIGCQSDYKDLQTRAIMICHLDWTFYAQNRGHSRGFTKKKIKIGGNISKSLSLNLEQVQFNVDSPFKDC